MQKLFFGFLLFINSQILPNNKLERPATSLQILETLRQKSQQANKIDDIKILQHKINDLLRLCTNKFEILIKKTAIAAQKKQNYFNNLNPNNIPSNKEHLFDDGSRFRQQLQQYQNHQSLIIQDCENLVFIKQMLAAKRQKITEQFWQKLVMQTLETNRKIQAKNSLTAILQQRKYQQLDTNRYHQRCLPSIEPFDQQRLTFQKDEIRAELLADQLESILKSLPNISLKRLKHCATQAEQINHDLQQQGSQLSTYFQTNIKLQESLTLHITKFERDCKEFTTIPVIKKRIYELETFYNKQRKNISDKKKEVQNNQECKTLFRDYQNEEKEKNLF